MRGRKPLFVIFLIIFILIIIKKESPNEGTETAAGGQGSTAGSSIKKESPNEGTETQLLPKHDQTRTVLIKKESPNEGTETLSKIVKQSPSRSAIKKESPNEGTETLIFPFVYPAVPICNKKRIPE